MVENFKNFNESSKIDLYYYCFDYDDNLLFMPTKIHMDQLIDNEWVPKDVSTSKYAKIRKSDTWRIRNNSILEAFNEFRDFGPRGKMAFIEDSISAITSKKFAPSWGAFIKCLTRGSVFAIITARGHSPNVMRKVVEYIIDNILTKYQQFNLYANCLKFAYLFKDHGDYDRLPKKLLSETDLVKDYLDKCDFYGVSSDYFVDKFGLGDASNPEKGKEVAIKEFSKKVNSFGKLIGANNISIGFSDDDIKTMQHIEELFSNELSLEYLIKYYLYDTSDKLSIGGKKREIKKVIEGQSDWGLGSNTWGTGSSIIPFTKWNNMTQNFYPNSNDEPNDDYHNQFKNQIGQLKDLTNDLNKNKISKNEKSKKVRKFRNRGIRNKRRSNRISINKSKGL